MTKMKMKEDKKAEWFTEEWEFDARAGSNKPDS